MADVCERWWGELLKHPLLGELRKGDRRVNEPAKNLLFCLDSDIFFWDGTKSVFYTTNLKHLNTGMVPYQVVREKGRAGVDDGRGARVEIDGGGEREEEGEGLGQGERMRRERSGRVV